MNVINRRSFLARSAGVATLVSGLRPTQIRAQEALSRPAQVPLGKTGITVSRLAQGTGMSGGNRQSNHSRLGFEKLVLPELQRDPNTVDLFLIDEIGKMECFCPRFVEAMNDLLAQDVPLVATVSLHGKGLIQDVKLRDDVDIITINSLNRDTLPKLILNRFRS